MSSDSDAGMRDAEGGIGDGDAGVTAAAQAVGTASKPRRTVTSDSDDSDAAMPQRKSVGRDESDGGNDGDLSATGGGVGSRGGGLADLGLSTDSDSQSDDGLGVGAARERGPASGSASAGSTAAGSAAGKAADKSSIHDLFGDSDGERESDDEGLFDDSDRPVRRRDTKGDSATMAAAAAGGSIDGDGGGSASVAAAKAPERDALRLPVVPRPRSSAGTDVYVAKLTKILGLQERCFDPDTFDPEKESEEFKMAQSVVRWRMKRDAAGAPQYNADGSPCLETNTRLVKWSDGSMQLMVGGDAFNVMVQPNDRSFLFVQHKGTAAAAGAKGKGGSSTQGTCLECQGRLPQKMAFQPQLGSRQHQNMALMIRSNEAVASQQRGRVAMQEAAPAKDPQWVKEQRIRQSEEQKKSERRRRSGYDKYGAPNSSRGSRGGRRVAGMDPRYLEEGDEGDYDTVGAGAIKDDVRRGRYDQQSDDDDSDEDGGRASALLRAKQDSRAAARKRSAARGGAGGSDKPRRRRGGGRKNDADYEDDDDEEDEEEEEEEAEDGDSEEEDEEPEDSQAEDSSADGGSDGGGRGGRGGRGSRKRRASGSGKAAAVGSASAAAGSGDEEGSGFVPGGDSEEDEEGAGAAAAIDRGRQQKRARRTVAQDSDSD